MMGSFLRNGLDKKRTNTSVILYNQNGFHSGFIVRRMFFTLKHPPSPILGYITWKYLKVTIQYWTSRLEDARYHRSHQFRYSPNKSFGNYSILCQAEALQPYNLLDGSAALWYHHAT